MTLCLAVVTEEGIVLASDSLGTLTSLQKGDLAAECGKCHHKGIPDMLCPKCGENLGHVPSILTELPTSHTFHCQKLFRLNR